MEVHAVPPLNDRNFVKPRVTGLEGGHFVQIIGTREGGGADRIRKWPRWKRPGKHPRDLPCTESCVGDLLDFVFQEISVAKHNSKRSPMHRFMRGRSLGLHFGHKDLLETFVSKISSMHRTMRERSLGFWP